jgi:tetratricopeptide (TPR) repeat protein
VVAQPDTVAYRLRRFVGRNRAAVAAAAILTATLIGSAVVSARQARALEARTLALKAERDKSEQVVGVLVDLFETTNPAVRPDAARLTVGAFLTGAEARALGRLADQPLVAARLQQVFARIHGVRGEHTEAKEILERVLAEQTAALGPDHVDTLESERLLGAELYELGDAARSKALLEESVARHRRIYGPRHERTATALASLASAVGASDPEKALPLLEETLAIRREILPPDHPDVASSLGGLATYHAGAVNFAAARALYEEGLEALGPPGRRRHPVAVTLMNDLGVLFSQQSQYADAARMLREARALARDVLGPGTLPEANLVNNLAVSLASLGRHAEAESAFRDSYDLHVSLVGREHWRSTNAARNVGQILALQRRFDDALPWFDRALANREAGASMWGVRAQRAMVVFRLGRIEEGIAELRRAVGALDTPPERDAHAYANSRILLGRALVERHRAGDAEPVLREAVAWLQRYPADHPWRAEAACELGRARAARSGVGDERAGLESCLAVYRSWGLADQGVVASIDALLASRGAPAAPSATPARPPRF